MVGFLILLIVLVIVMVIAKREDDKAKVALRAAEDCQCPDGWHGGGEPDCG